MDAEIWDRYGYSTMSRRLFVVIMVGLVAFGIVTSAVASSFSIDWSFDQPISVLGFSVDGGIQFLAFVLAVLVVSLAGVFVAQANDSSAISLVGYLMVTIPFGLLLGPVIGMYTEASVLRVLIVTTLVVVGLGAIGAIYPKSLESWGSFLVGALLVLLFGMFLAVPVGRMFGIPDSDALNFMDWVGILIFSGLIIFDMNRAMRVPATLDNAVDCAVAVYLDFINIFIRLLSLMGNKKD